MKRERDWPPPPAAPDCGSAEYDPPRNDDADRERAAHAQWRLGSGRGEMTEAERDLYIYGGKHA